jgi:hypothetical protein
MAYEGKLPDEAVADHVVPSKAFPVLVAPNLRASTLLSKEELEYLAVRNTLVIDLNKDMSRVPYKSQMSAKLSKSERMLMAYAFDPLENLLRIYASTCREVIRQEHIRDGLLAELLNNGKARAYRPEIHMAWQEKMITIAKELLRYGYARVSETTVVESRNTKPLIVNLTKKGEQYVINDEEPIEEGEFDGD